MGDKIKKFIDCYIPVTTCNLRCHYCYITQQHQFANEIPKFEYSPDFIARALSKKRLGGTCCINFCGGGETLLPREMTAIIEALLKEGHYVMVVTNGTVSARFNEIINLDKELLKRLFFKFSFQYLELKRTNFMEEFFNNIKKVRSAGCSFSLEITPNDEIIPLVDEIKEIALKNVGALPHITVARDNSKEDLPILTNLSKKEYKKFWGQFKSEMFRYKLSVFNKKRKEFCYAGAWSYHLNLLSGDLKQCYMGEVLQNIYDDINAPIIEKPIGYGCLESHCYNAHAWLTWGDIPEHKAPTYLAMRDRIDKNGEHWVKEPIYSFFKTKVYQSNKRLSLFEKIKRRKSMKFLEKIFSVKNEYTNKKRKVVTILGMKMKFSKKELPFLDRFEVHITDHCNLNCKGCSHFCPVCEEKFVDVKQFEKDFKCLSKKINPGAIRLLGGEPLLHKELPKLMKIARKYFPTHSIHICTNGILIPAMKEDFWNAVNENKIYVDMSKYPGLADKFDSYVEIIKNHTEFLGDINDVGDFGYILNKEGNSDYVKTYHKCKNKYFACANLRDGFFHICARCYLDHFNKYFNTDLPYDKGIDIYKTSGEEIVKYLNTPQEICRFCYEDRPTFPWGISEKKQEEWI